MEMEKKIDRYTFYKLDLLLLELEDMLYENRRMA